MLNKWSLNNFKSVGHADLELKPLTLLVGANSSGKSTLIQSMLLIAQSLSSQVSSRALILNGPMTRLGGYGDIQTFESPEAITISWDATFSEGRRRFMVLGSKAMKNVRCTVTFGESSTDKREVAQLNPELRLFRLESLRDDGSVAGFIEIQRSAATIDERLVALGIGTPASLHQLEKGLQYTVTFDTETTEVMRRDPARGEIVGCVMRHFVPVGLVARINRVERIMSRICSQPEQWPTFRYESGTPVALAPEVLKFLAEALTPQQRRQIGVSESELSIGDTVSDWFTRLLRLAPATRTLIASSYQRNREAIEQLVRSSGPIYILSYDHGNQLVNEAAYFLVEEFAEGFRYLGPLREEPKSIHPLGLAIDPKSVGLRGEHAAAVFNMAKDDPVTYLPPSAIAVGFRSPKIHSTLQEAVYAWLHHMELAETVDAMDRGKLGHELRVTLSGTSQKHDLTHVGVGVSQVFPIIVMALIAEPGSVLIFEQPELHLHPKVQAALADFFLAISSTGTQCIVETHSEYLVNRLRLRAAESDDDHFGESQLIYFVEKDLGKTSFRKVDVNAYGAVIHWPAGFFDTSLIDSERLIAASWKKREARQKQRALAP